MVQQRIDDHTLKVLEFDGVQSLLASFANSGLGKDAALALYPSMQAEWISSRLAETTELKSLLEHGHRLPLAGMRDVRDLFKLIGQKQTVFEPDQLLDICSTLEVSGRIKKFFSALPEDNAGHLRALGRNLQDYQEIVDQINRCINGDGTVRDQASDRLKEIRRQIGQLGQAIQQKFKAIISSPHMRNAIENENFLTRNGRAVVALKTNYKHMLKGIIIDRSNTGATLYIEPYELAELSNELEDILSEEKKEVWQILWTLTRLILDHQKEINLTVRVLAQIDLAYAKAKFSLKYNMAPPLIRPDSPLRFNEARHPLLLQWAGRQDKCPVSQVMDEIIPIDVRLGDDFDLLLLTGPNTGGKTVALKTIGLLTLMAQSGMHIPARVDSRLPVYQQIFADVGDEQSIQQSLSTFSAHMQQIIKIVEQSRKSSLVLLDELGAGTDPIEAAALGTALLDRLLWAGGHVVVTTHLGQLKSYAYTTIRAENASMQFDLTTLKPTFRLLIGTPGSSNALAVARKLGMLPAIIDKAQLLLAQGEDSASELINQVQATRAAAEEKRTRAQALLQAVKAIHILASERLERTEQERADLMNQADLTIDKSMRQVRDLLHEYVSDLSHAPKPWCERFEELSRRIDQAATNTPLALRQTQFIETIRKGDSVYIMPFRREGVVLRLRPKKKTIILQMDGKQLEVPFTEIWPVDKFRSE